MGLCLAYRVAQVGHSDAGGDLGIAQDHRCVGEWVEESNSRAEKDRRDIDMEFVEEAGVEQLLDGVGAVDPNGLPAGVELDVI